MDTGWTSALIGGLAAAVVTPLLMKWLQKAAPGEPLPALSEEERAALIQKYMKVEFAQIGMFLLLFPVLAVAISALLWGASELFAMLRPAGLLTVKPWTMVWALPGMLLGIVACFPPLDLIARRWLKERYAEYELAQKLKAGGSIDFKRLRWRAIPAALLLIAFLVLLNDWYTRFEPERIVMNRFLGLGETARTYTDVERVVLTKYYTAPNGNQVNRRVLCIVFKDKSYWSNEEACGEPYEDNRPQFDRVAALLKEKTGKPVEEVGTLEEALR